MPGMKGFELLEEAGSRYPDLKRVLITAYDVRDYMHMAKRHDVGNIMTKTTPFNFTEIESLVSSLLTDDIFGIDKYIGTPTQHCTIAHADQIEPCIERVLESFEDEAVRRKFRLGLGEIVINAFFYGAKDGDGSRKEQWDMEGRVPEGQEVEIAWGVDGGKSGIAVRDRKGKLTKREILHWLDRNSTKTDKGLAIGILDEHGKGLFITRETVDRVIVNIARNRQTEVIMLNYRDGLYNGHRPLWIQEV
jgi:hypothetical protein